MKYRNSAEKNNKLILPTFTIFSTLWLNRYVILIFHRKMGLSFEDYTMLSSGAKQELNLFLFLVAVQ